MFVSRLRYAINSLIYISISYMFFLFLFDIYVLEIKLRSHILGQLDDETEL